MSQNDDCPRGFAADGKTPTYTYSGAPILVSAVEFNRVYGELQKARAALANQRAEVPGWKLVPVEPTHDMLGLGCHEWAAAPAGEPGSEVVHTIYRAMLAAAPAQPEQQAPFLAEIEACRADPGPLGPPATVGPLPEQQASSEQPKVSEARPVLYSDEHAQQPERAAGELTDEEIDSAMRASGLWSLAATIPQNRALLIGFARAVLAAQRARDAQGAVAHGFTSEQLADMRLNLALRSDWYSKMAVQLIDSVAAPQSDEARDAWQPIETAPENTGDLVVVYWIDEAGGERYDLDYTEDGCWMQWHDRAEHVEIIGGHGVSYTPPYTHWMPLHTPSAMSTTKGAK